MDFLDKYASQIMGITRIVIGLLFLEHGTAKVLSFPLAAGAAPHAFNLMSFPVGPAGIIELVGGALIVVGYFSRWAAFIASGEMALRLFPGPFSQKPVPDPEWRRRGDLLLLYLLAAGGQRTGRVRPQQEIAVFGLNGVCPARCRAHCLLEMRGTMRSRKFPARWRACWFWLCASAAYANDAGVDATVKAFADAFNKGDMKAAKALHTASPLIIDEVPPHLWSGANAFDSWGADAGQVGSGGRRSGGQVDHRRAHARSGLRRSRLCDRAHHLHLPAEGQDHARDSADDPGAGQGSGGAWKIASWTWTGPEAKPVQ